MIVDFPVSLMRVFVLPVPHDLPNRHAQLLILAHNYLNNIAQQNRVEYKSVTDFEHPVNRTRSIQ